MRDGHGQRNMPHTLAAHNTARHAHAALVTDHVFITDPLVLPAIALPVFGRAKDPLTKQAVFLRFLGPVVNGLWLGDFAMRPIQNLLRRGQRQLHRVKFVGLLLKGIVVHYACASCSCFDDSCASASAMPPNSSGVPSAKSTSGISATSSPLSSLSSPKSFTSASSWPAITVSASTSVPVATSGRSLTSSTPRARLWSSLTKTLNDSGIRGPRIGSALMIAS